MTTTRRDDLGLALCSAVAMALATIATWRGPGLSVDSVGYLSTGINIARGRGWVMLADQPLTIFPPGLPLLAALGEAVGIGADTALRLVSILSVGGVVALGGVLLRRATPHRGVALWATGLLGVSPVLLGISQMVWSEPPFIAVVLAFLLALGGVVERRELRARDVVALSALCWVAFLLRYIGLSLVATGIVVLVGTLWPLGRTSLLRIGAFVALSGLAPIAVAIRNHSADGTWFGNRLPSHDSLVEVAGRTAATFGEWLVPVSGSGRLPLAVLGGAGTVLLLIGLGAMLRATPDAGPDAEPERRRRAVLACSASFAFVYVVYLTGAALSTSFEPTNSRYLSPVLVPAVVVAAAGAAHGLRGASRAGRTLAAMAAVVALVGHLAVAVDDARDGAANGIGFNRTTVRQSALSAATLELLHRSPAAVVYSNDPNALWGATRVQPIRWEPRLVGFRGAPLHGELERFVEEVRCASNDVYLVLFLTSTARVVPLAELREVLQVERVAAAPDGAIFSIDAPAGGRACQGPPARPARVP